MPHLVVIVEWAVSHAEDMITWCRNNGLPVVHHWIDPVLDHEGDHVSDYDHYMGTRGLYTQRYREANGSSPFDGSEILCYVFLIRPCDYVLWKLRFQVVGDRMYLQDGA